MGSLFSPRKLIISSVLIIQVGFFNVAAKQSAVAMPDTFSAHAAKAVLEQGGNAISLLKLHGNGRPIHEQLDEFGFRLQPVQPVPVLRESRRN